MSSKKHGEIVQASKAQRPGSKREPMILGAQAVNPAGTVKRLDSRSKPEPVEIEMRSHGDLVTVRSHVRSKPLRKDEPDVRIRAMTPEQKKAWNRARKAED